MKKGMSRQYEFLRFSAFNTRFGETDAQIYASTVYYIISQIIVHRLTGRRQGPAREFRTQPLKQKHCYV